MSTYSVRNRFNVAVHLFSNRSKMTSKCGKNKKSGTQGYSRVCHWCSYHILMSSVINHWTDARQHGIYLFYTIKKQTILKIFKHNSKAGPLPTLTNTKITIWPHHYLYKMEQTDWLPGIAKNCDWFMEIRSLSNLNQATLVVVVLQWEQNWTAKSKDLIQNK